MSKPTKIAITLAAAGMSLLGPQAQAAAPIPRMPAARPIRSSRSS